MKPPLLTRGSWTLALFLGLSGAAAAAVLLRSDEPPDADGATLLRLAADLPRADAGNLSGPGIPYPIVHRGSRLLAADENGWHCVGFTFAAAVAFWQHAGVVDAIYLDEMQQLQQDWYNATPASEEKGSVFAMQRYGLGREVRLVDARPGDFLQMWWGGGGGHQGIFTGWVTNARGEAVGVRYLGAQGEDNGFGEAEDLFVGSGLPHADLLPERTYAGRLYQQRTP